MNKTIAKQRNNGRRVTFADVDDNNKIMKFIAAQSFRLLLMVSLISSIAACATTNEPAKAETVDKQATQYEQAKAAYNQQNFDQAALLLKPLAEQGHTDAQYALGYMYYNGQGVPYNYKLAIQWLSVAAAKGSKKAAEALHRLSLSDNSDDEKQITAAPKQSSEQATATMTPVPTALKPDEPAGTTVQKKPAPAVKAMATAAMTKAQTILSADEQWIMQQPADNVTLQLMATGKEVALQRFIKENDLQESAVYYQTRRNGRNWYTLIQGSFESYALAKIALSKLAPSLQAAKPWIKPMAGIQRALAAR